MTEKEREPKAERCLGELLFVFAVCRHVTVGRHMTGSVWTSPHLPSQHIPPFTASQRRREDGESEKKDRFQYQPVIWLLRLDRIMPYRQTLRNLPLMKYDMCANGAPPPIQQPVITFQNKYTKRLLKKKKRGSCFTFLVQGGRDLTIDALPL